jgi:hypothetical protein
MIKIKKIQMIVMVALITIMAGCGKNDPEPSPTDPRLSFTGRWSVNEVETKLTYEVEVETDPAGSNSVLIYNFANSGGGEPAVAFVSGNTITLEVNQIIGDGWIVNGSGYLSGGKVYWNYTLNDGANLHQLTAVYTRI